MKLTTRQVEVLAFVKTYIENTGYPPTRVDIAAALGFRSANSAEEHLKALARKGAIEMVPGRSRGIRLLPGQPGLPIVGRVAAGNPILAEENIEDYCELPASFFRPKADFLLLVKGDSMMDAGILEGDLLAVHKTPDVTHGDLVVARIDNEVTVKRLQQTDNNHSITLLPENPNYSPINVDLRRQDFAIEGICVGLLRH